MAAPFKNPNLFLKTIDMTFADGKIEIKDLQFSDWEEWF